MKKRNRLATILILIIICVCAFISLRYFVAIVMTTPMQMTPLDDPPSLGDGHKIDPDTILADINKGKTDIFQISNEGRPEPKYPSGSFAWSSADYLAIAKAHHLYLTGKPANGEWKLFAPGNFDIYQCRDNMKGFDSATIIFFKRNPDSFPVTYIEILPLRNFVYSASSYYKRTTYDTWLAKLLFDPDASYEEALPIEGSMTAERALQIAEEAGGAEMRNQLSNDSCRIHIAYFKDKWVVWYYWGGSAVGFEIEIDTYDGSYKVKDSQ